MGEQQRGHFLGEDLEAGEAIISGSTHQEFRAPLEGCVDVKFHGGTFKLQETPNLDLEGKPGLAETVVYQRDEDGEVRRWGFVPNTAIKKRNTSVY